ncbi:hypothetical protein [Salinibacterium sp. TMP30]|uniref:hypothetical protein n=1 Tax=Salinibacterium sp. TMP30 TaxID=3138237 RepID=UPI003139B995
MITSQRTLRSTITLVIAAGITVSLSGCFSNPLENLANGLIEGTVENVIEGSTGVDVDVSPDGTGGSLPDSWPAEVPVPDGAIVFSLAVGGSYSATITVGSPDNAQAGYEKLLASGYEMTSEISLGEGAYAYGLQSDGWVVQYSWGEDDEGTATVNISAGPTGE